MSDGGGDTGSGGGGKGGGGKGESGGGFSGTSAAMGPSGPPNQNTVGASIGSTNTPMFPIFGGSFSAGGGDPLAGITGGGAPNTSSMANPQGNVSFGGNDPLAGITASPTTGTNAAAFSAPSGLGGSPSDLTGMFDPLNPGGAQAAPAAPSGGGAAPPAAPPSAAPAGGGEKSMLESLGIKNPLGAAIGAGGLAYSALQGQQQPKFSPEMEAAARNLDANGRQLMSYLQSGNLPPGLKASLDQATSSAKAKIISNFASQGLNTDPTQNSALAQQLAQVDQQAIISTAQMGQQLMQTGLAESGLSSDLYKTLANIDQTQTANIGKTIAAFAASMSGGGGGINLKLG